jgi:hypothetical protein
MRSKPKTFPTPHIGHSRHGLFFTKRIVNPMLNLLKRTMTYPGFDPGTFGVAVSIPNHYNVNCHCPWSKLKLDFIYRLGQKTQLEFEKSISIFVFGLKKVLSRIWQKPNSVLQTWVGFTIQKKYHYFFVSIIGFLFCGIIWLLGYCHSVIL